MQSRRLVVWISIGILVLLRQGWPSNGATHPDAQFCSRPQGRWTVPPASMCFWPSPTTADGAGQAEEFGVSLQAGGVLAAGNQPHRHDGIAGDEPSGLQLHHSRSMAATSEAKNSAFRKVSWPAAKAMWG